MLFLLALGAGLLALVAYSIYNSVMKTKVRLKFLRGALVTEALVTEALVTEALVTEALV